jgi:hypothetical protein
MERTSNIAQGSPNLLLPQATISASLGTISRPVFSDPLTAGLKPISNGETRAQREMISEVPAIRGELNWSMQHHLI